MDKDVSKWGINDFVEYADCHGITDDDTKLFEESVLASCRKVYHDGTVSTPVGIVLMPKKKDVGSAEKWAASINRGLRSQIWFLMGKLSKLAIKTMIDEAIYERDRPAEDRVKTGPG
jgi:hypothetical protein